MEASHVMQEGRTLTVLHFNDVYHLGSYSTASGGMRHDRLLQFWLKLREFDFEQPLVCCSGDFLAPSLASAFTKGKHMMEAIELLNVDVGTLGNHDFDFGVERARELLMDPILFDDSRAAKSKWVLTNIIAPSGSPLPGCHEHLLLNHHGVLVGIIALSENWLPEAGLGAHSAKWLPEVDAGRVAARDLRAKGAEVVLCLVHSNVCNTEPLAAALAEDVDFFLGGHEHIVAPEPFIRGQHNWLISGWEFEHFSIIRFRLPAMAADVAWRPEPPDVQRVKVPAADPLPCGIPGCDEIRKFVATCEADLLVRLREPVGSCAVDLECRKFKLRTQETNAGNLFADICLKSLESKGAEVGFLISGTISSHRVWPAADLTMEFVVSVFPWEGAFVLMELPGACLRQALEHGVSLLPRRFGRFPQVSGVSFAVDVDKPQGSRVSEIAVKGEPLDDDRLYLIATTDYIAEGGDDYDMLVKHGRVVIGEEYGPRIHDSCCQYFAETLAPHPLIEGRIRHLRSFQIHAEDEELAELGSEVEVCAWLGSA